MSSYTEALLRQTLEPELERVFVRFCNRRFAEVCRRHRRLTVFQINGLKRDIGRELRPAFDEAVDRLVAEHARKIEVGD